MQCPACYAKKVYCRRCKGSHCLCSWAQCKALPRMKIHKAISGPGSFGGTLTTTLCGRMNNASQDGMNSSAESNQVTCGFCLKKLRPND